MISWANTKQRAAFAAAVVLFAAAIYVADEADPGLALIPFVFVLICSAGVWTFGLPKSQNPSDAEWMDATR